MLYLERGRYDSIMIGDDIEIKIMAVGKNGAVNVGIQAPKEVKILRRELWDMIKNSCGRVND